MLPWVTGWRELEALVEEVGFLPLFQSPVPGFSLKDCTPEAYWFKDGVEGPWEWREAVAENRRVAYGKLFGKKAGFVSREWYPHLANYRRDGYDFDARYDDGLASTRAKQVMDLLEMGPKLSGELKAAIGGKGFDGLMAGLQMQAYVCMGGFVYKTSKKGVKYGTGATRFYTAEALLGADCVTAAYDLPPEESYRLMYRHLAGLCPNAEEKQLRALLK